MGNESTPVSVETLQCIAGFLQCVGAPLLIYASFIVGREMGGLMSGHRGLGIETHKKVVQSVSEFMKSMPLYKLGKRALRK